MGIGGDNLTNPGATATLQVPGLDSRRSSQQDAELPTRRSNKQDESSPRRGSKQDESSPRRGSKQDADTSPRRGSKQDVSLSPRRGSKQIAESNLRRGSKQDAASSRRGSKMDADLNIPKFKVKLDRSSDMPEEDDEAEELSWRLKMPSSELFETIMSDIDTKMQDRFRRQLDQKKTEGDIGEESNEAGENPSVFDISDDDLEDESSPEMDNRLPFNHPLRQVARRSWAIMRRYVREQAMAAKTQNKSAMNWGMLRQTLANMTNMERARENMYDKYLYCSNPNAWSEGIKNIPDNFKYGRKGRLLKRLPRPVADAKTNSSPIRSAPTNKTSKKTKKKTKKPKVSLSAGHEHK